ncbi:MAG TPA: glycosyltransferase family 1 protein [Ktedonobacterales bacterium]
MRILVDYTSGIAQSAGIGRYTRNLVDALVALDHDDQFTLFSADRPNNTRGFPVAANVRTAVAPLSNRRMTTLWHRLRFPLPIEALAGGADVFHSPDFALPPVARARTVVTIHDLAFITHPECAVPSLRQYMLRITPRAVRRADRIIAVSRCTADDLVRLMDVPREKITTIHLGVDPGLQRLSDEMTLAQVATKYGLRRPFALAVGTIEPRKNYERLIQAFAGVAGKADAPAQLVIVGRRGWLYQGVYEALERARLGVAARLLEQVSDRELAALYSMAAVVVTPSMYEGFGIPAVEAMAYGIPVIVSDGGSLPEIVGDAGMVIPVADVQGLGNALVRVVSDEPLRRAMSEASIQRARLFDWGAAARATLNVYRQAAGSS